jgi:hypothetical protein
VSSIVQITGHASEGNWYVEIEESLRKHERFLKHIGNQSKPEVPKGKPGVLLAGMAASGAKHSSRDDLLYAAWLYYRAKAPHPKQGHCGLGISMADADINNRTAEDLFSCTDKQIIKKRLVSITALTGDVGFCVANLLKDLRLLTFTVTSRNGYTTADRVRARWRNEYHTQRNINDNDHTP